MDKGKTILQDLSALLFETILRDGKKLNFNTIILVGGEPILHPDFEKLIQIVRQYGYNFLIISNGWFYKEYWRALGESKKNLVRINLSLDGTTADIHDGIRDKKGSFGKVLEAADFYQKHDVRVGVKFLVTKQNFHQIADLINFCRDRKINDITFMAEVPSSHSNLAPEERVLATRKISDLREKFNDVLNIKMAASFFKESDHGAGVHFCTVLDGQRVFIDFQGGMLPCPDIYSDYENRPLIQNIGFEKSYLAILETINELKKRRLGDLLHGAINTNAVLCDYCDKNLKDCLITAGKRRPN